MIYTRLHALARSCLAALALASVVLMSPVAAEARSIKFGSDEVLRESQDVSLKSAKGEALYIGHKLTFHWLGLPYGLSDDGYIVGVKGKTLYYDVTREQIAGWQSKNLLPSPLPTYQLGILDYAMGYLLWISLALVALWWLVRTLLAKAKPAAASAAAPWASPRDTMRRLIQAARSALTMPRLAIGRAPLARASLPAARPPAADRSAATASSAALRLLQFFSPPHHQKARHVPQQPAPRHDCNAQQSVHLPPLPVARTRCRVKALKIAC